MIHGGRVRQVREMRGLTQAQLADLVPGLSQYRLSRVESDLAHLDEETQVLLAATLGVLVEYLERPGAGDLAAHSPQFRARDRLTRRERLAALGWARLVEEEYLRLELTAQPIPLALEPMPASSPVEAAHRVRALLGFSPGEPLPYLLLALERLGVTILALPYTLATLDAFSAWHADQPVIAVLGDAPGERTRYAVAHEVGHLLLHAPGSTGGAVEAEADAFADELLTPSHALKRALPARTTLTTLAMLKTQWGVSIKTLIRRSRDLGHIDPQRATGLYRQLSARGFNRGESGHVPAEKPRALRKMAEIRCGAGIDADALARDAGWSHELAHAVLERHATAAELPFETSQQSPLHTGNVLEFKRPPAAKPRKPTSRRAALHPPGSPTH